MKNMDDTIYKALRTPRACATAVGYNSMLIVVGGVIKSNNQWVAISTTELLDTNDGYWCTCGELPSPHTQMKAATVNDKLYLLGGFDKDRIASPQMFVASLDALSNYQLNWQSVPNTPWCLSAPAVFNGSLLTVGGFYTSDLCSFNPSTGKWQQVQRKIPEERAFPAAVSVGVGDILVIGGVNNSSMLTTTVWIRRVLKNFSFKC